MFKPVINIAASGFQCCLLLVLLAQPLQCLSSNSSNEEYKLKAALLFKLTRFVEWPDDTIDKMQGNFGICVLGDRRFSDALQILEGRKVDKNQITVQFFKQSAGIGNTCQMVFISESKSAFLKPILKTFEKQPILTISDIDGFAEKGGIIQFTHGGKRIGFKINLQQAKNSDLKIAAPLLELSTIVETRVRRTRQ